MKVVSPSAISLPPYIVFCPVNANVFARGSPIAALMTMPCFPFAPSIVRLPHVFTQNLCELTGIDAAAAAKRSRPRG